MLNWLKHNLYNRWSFNLLIWHGLRTILRIGSIYTISYLSKCFPNLFPNNFDMFLLCFAPHIQALIIFPPIIVFLLERKLGFRFTPKIFENNIIFVLYVLLAIPALLIEVVVLSFSFYIFITYSFDIVAGLFNFAKLQETLAFIFNPYILIWTLIWII